MVYHDEEEDESLRYQLHLLHVAIKKKHPFVATLERKTHRFLALAGWTLSIPILYLAYQNYLQYVPSTEKLVLIDNTMFLSFFAPLANLFHFLFLGVPCLAFAYAAGMALYSVVVLFVDESHEKLLREKLMIQRIGWIAAAVVGVFVMGAWYLNGFHQFIVQELAKGKYAELEDFLVIGAITLAYFACYLFTYRIFSAEPRKSPLNPYYTLSTFLKTYFTPAWWLLLVLCVSLGPFFIPISLEFLISWYVIKFIFSPKFWYAIAVGAVGLLIGALGSAVGEIGSGGRRD